MTTRKWFVKYTMDDGSVVRVPVGEVEATKQRQHRELEKAKVHAELARDEHIGEHIEQQRQISSVHGAKGGRPPKAELYARWLDDYDYRRKASRGQLTAREIYEDIAENEKQRIGKPVPWTRIRDGISEARIKLNKGKSSVPVHVPEPREEAGDARDLAAKAVGVGGKKTVGKG